MAATKYNVVDLFSGVGGLSYGFECMEEFSILAANELEPDIARAYRKKIWLLEN